MLLCCFPFFNGDDGRCTHTSHGISHLVAHTSLASLFFDPLMSMPLFDFYLFTVCNLLRANSSRSPLFTRTTFTLTWTNRFASFVSLSFLYAFLFPYLHRVYSRCFRFALCARISSFTYTSEQFFLFISSSYLGAGSLFVYPPNMCVCT